MSVPNDSEYDPAGHLSVSDIAVDNPRELSMVRIRIKQSKTDPFRRGITLFVGRTSSDLCPVAALMGYLQVRGWPSSLVPRWARITRVRFAEEVRAALQAAGVSQLKYCTHSFRLGAATTAAAAKGVEDSVIKTLGRWESVAYLQYVRIPQERLTAYSQRFVE